MKPIFVYSGTFDPPTYGHYNLLQKALEVFPEIIIVCSDHSKLPTKFSLDERVALWESYSLPKGVRVETFEEFLKRGIPGKNIILIRGLRSEADGNHEAIVLLDSAKNANVSKTFTLVAPKETAHISSSLVWEEAAKESASSLESLVSPGTKAAVLNKLNR
jgi:pantetheine-phosphate adenylyltransferase